MNNATQPLSPYLKSLVDQKVLSPMTAELFNQLKSFQLQKLAVAAWPHALRHAAEKLCEELQYPEGKIRYQRPEPSVPEKSISPTDPSPDDSPLVEFIKAIRRSWAASDIALLCKNVFKLVYMITVCMTMWYFLLSIPYWFIKKIIRAFLSP